MINYQFDETIEKEVLENYLSRAVTAADFINSITLEDDLRAIKNLGVKFIGRASGIWEPEKDDAYHFLKTKNLADTVHAVDPDIILQACIFEAIYINIETFPIPAYVFKDFGLDAEERCFRFSDTLFPERPEGFIWGEIGSIPDLNRLETQLWFYYRATSYIDAGFEALHMGQIHLYTANDRGFVKTGMLFTKIREYAKKHARRHKVLLDAHSHGISINGQLLLDYHAMPFTRVPLLKEEGEKLVLVREGYSEGGMNPNGWSAEVMPYLMEYDNWGGRVADDSRQYTKEELAWMDWWGYDQIGWFASQDEESRNHFIEYTYRWIAVNNINAYFEVPFRRGIGSAAVSMLRADTNELDLQDCYQINTKSEKCPMGFGQEEKIKELWHSQDTLRKKAGNPCNIIDFGGKEVYDQETGVKLPEEVVLYGSFQPYVGAVKNDSNSGVTRMYYVGDNTYVLTIVLPYQGEFDFAVSTYGTLSATYCKDRFPRSGSSNKGYFRTYKDNAVVRFTYRFIDNDINIEYF